MSGTRGGVAVIALLLLALPAFATPSLLPLLERPRAGERILVVAAHIDDEGLAAGGYVSDAVAAGAEVFIVYLTAGDHSRTALAANRLTFFATAPLNRKGDRRMREGRVAARGIGLDESNLLLLGYPDRGLRRMLLRPDRDVRSASTGKRVVPYGDARSPGAPYRLESLLTDLAAVIDQVQPDLIIAPDDRDHHPDHHAAAMLLTLALEELGLVPERLGYVIHTRGLRLSRRTHTQREHLSYPLTPETQQRKREMLADYRSQRRSPYLRMLFARSRGAQEVFSRYPG
jgi:LmbE family N-acetylglucosaminyl deacetylase